MLKPKFNKQALETLVRIRAERMKQVIINRLVLIGETFVSNARQSGNYGDITGNLRSSIGYVVLNNGQTIKQNFSPSNKGSDKVEGVQKAKDFIKELASTHFNGYTLIVVAGMDYAAAVESRGKDVLTASSIIAKNDLAALFKKIQ